MRKAGGSQAEGTKKIRKIISGGQTGVDRAAFDFALRNGIEISGFVPLGRRAEDGQIPLKYPNLTETATSDYVERTELNVRHSDATLILSHGPLTDGSLLTRKFAEKYGKPFLHIDFELLSMNTAVEKASNWLDSIDCQNLNIAGPRSSADPRIYRKTEQFLRKLFKRIGTCRF